MKTTLLCAFALAAVACCSPVAAQAQKCQLRNAPKGWHRYVDQARGFCFLYPPQYQRISNGDRTNLIAFRLAGTEGELIVSGGDDPFDLQELVKIGATGYGKPPEAMRFGKNTFYYYGPGGRDMEYPDQYFYNLHGKTLYIGFDGSYARDKTPSGEIKTLERQILTTFSVF